jgi:hypothetical protein
MLLKLPKAPLVPPGALMSRAWSRPAFPDMKTADPGENAHFKIEPAFTSTILGARIAIEETAQTGGG